MHHIMEYLFDIAINNGIAIVKVDELAPETPSISLKKRRAVVLNMNWYNSNEIPFILAHEMAHMLNNDSFVLYTSSAISKIEMEGATNRYAISMLINYSKIEDTNLNPVQFMEQFGVPCKYESLVSELLSNKSTFQ